MGRICPMLANQYPKIFSIFYFFFHFKCILLQISHKKCFFINIFILRHSGVKMAPKSQPQITNTIFTEKALILPCTGVCRHEDVLRFNQCETVNNFVEKD